MSPTLGKSRKSNFKKKARKHIDLDKVGQIGKQHFYINKEGDSENLNKDKLNSNVINKVEKKIINKHLKSTSSVPAFNLIKKRKDKKKLETNFLRLKQHTKEDNKEVTELRKEAKKQKQLGEEKLKAAEPEFRLKEKLNGLSEEMNTDSNLLIDRFKSLDKRGSDLLDFLIETLNTLISSNEDEQSLIDDFCKYLQYSDMKYFTIKSLLKIIKDKSKDSIDNKQFTDNVTKILLSIKLPLGNTEKGRKELDNLKPCILDDKFRLNYQTSSKLYTEIWLLFLSFKLTFDSYKKILAAMDSKILPHFKSPLNLTDFLINSYKIGGSVSLLSLSSLFLLITKYNLDYPDFFTNFYALVTPEILHVKYRSRFLYWADIFLSSTNLPAYVVASFVKKFSRLALIASVETLYPLIPLIANLLIRHPTLMELFNRTSSNEYINDPFNFEEKNLKETRALESSLWELKSLQKHWNQGVREKARFINYTLPKDEYDLSDLLEIDFPELIAEAFSENSEIDDNLELNKEFAENALEFFN